MAIKLHVQEPSEVRFGISGGDSENFNMRDIVENVVSTDYEDLENKPSINGVELVGNLSTEDLHIQAGVQSVNGQTGDVVLSIPSKTSELQNNSGFITGIDSSDVTTALGYTPYNATNPNGYVNASGAANAAPVQSVNGETGTVSLDASDVGALANDTVYALGVSAGSNAIRTNGILYGQVDDTSTKTVYTATITGVTEYYHGLSIMLRNGIVSSASGFTININGLGAKPVYSSMADATRDTTIFAAAYTMLFVYDENRVEGGCFVCYRGYNSDTNTIAYIMRLNSSSLPMTDGCGRYRMFFTSADGSSYVPSNTTTITNGTAARAVNQRPINPFGEIFYYNATTVLTAGDRPGASALCYSYQNVLGYAFNVNGNETLTAWKPCYLKCAPQSDGSAIMDASTPIVQDLPTTEDGKIYIFLGIAYDTTHMELHIGHPVYCYKDGHVRLWTNADIPTKTSDLTNDSGYITGMYIASYGNSTYADILAAYQANKVVYCRASSNANPGTGNQNRMAFLAYVNDPTTPTEFEFQYYRSVSTHSDSQQGDQVFVYKVNSSGTWSVTTREAYTKIVAGTGLTSSYNNGVITISLA